MKHHNKLLALALALTLALSLGLMGSASAAGTKTAADFPDFDSGAWYAQAVSAAVDNGLLEGTDQGLLLPEGNLTRAEMAAMVDRAFGTYMDGDISRFTDVPQDAWYYDEIAMAYHMGTYEGTGKRTMSPENTITRQEVLTILARALQLDEDRYEDTDLTRFADAAQVADWALPSVRAMVGAGYVQGRPEGLAPTASITRAEFAQLFHNIIGTYITTSGTYTQDYDGNLLVRTDGVTLRDLAIDGDLILGCGAADGAVTLDNVTVTGRVVVWGGGTDAVWMDNGTDVAELVVCRVDGPVKVIFDRDSTLAVYDDIQVTITDRAEEFEETEVIFYDISDILSEQDKVNDALGDSELSISMPAHLYAVVGETVVTTEIVDQSQTDFYRVELRRDDTGELVAEPVEIAPGGTQLALTLTEALPLGNYPCTATITALRDGQTVGTLELAITLHVAYLWDL